MMSVKSVMILRFIGTTPDCSRVTPLLTSLCYQVSQIYLQPLDIIPEDLGALTIHFMKLMACATADKPLCIFLDSLDQLSSVDKAYNMKWLPVDLPPNVKLVVSSQDQENGSIILNNIRTMLSDDHCYLHLTSLGKELSVTILRNWLCGIHRTLTEDQWQHVTVALTMCNLPLYVKLIYEEAKRWKSYNANEMLAVPISDQSSVMRDCISSLFQRLEVKHGTCIVTRALAYLTAGRNGLSDAEIEDLLSLDDEVLNDVYQYHIPPVRRIPPLLWTRIKNDLPGYFGAQETDGVNTINWYHRQFLEVAMQRFLGNINVKNKVHNKIADYFIGTQLKESESCSQPLYFTDNKKNITHFNKRKLGELSYHLLRSSRDTDMYEKVLYNVDWVFAKLSCLPFSTVISDYDDFLLKSPDNNVRLVRDTVRLASTAVVKYPFVIASQISGRLLPYYRKNAAIKAFINQCDDIGLRLNSLVPMHHCMHTPGGPLQYSLEGHYLTPYGVQITSDNRYLISVSNTFIVWDLINGDIVQMSPKENESKITGIMQTMALTPDNSHAIATTSHGQIIIWTTMSGDSKRLSNVLDNDDQVKGVATNNTHFVVWTTSQLYKFTMIGQRISITQCSLPEFSYYHCMVHPLFDYTAVIYKQDVDKFNTSAIDILVEFTATGRITTTLNFINCVTLSIDMSFMFGVQKGQQELSRLSMDYKTLEWSTSAVLYHDNVSPLLTLSLSEDERFLIGATTTGYKLWHLANGNKFLWLQLPFGNIPNSHTNMLMRSMVFTQNANHVITSVKNFMYVYATDNGDMIRCLDAHFERVITLQPWFAGGNMFVSSSHDNTIRVRLAFIAGTLAAIYMWNNINVNDKHGS